MAGDLPTRTRTNLGKKPRIAKRGLSQVALATLLPLPYPPRLARSGLYGIRFQRMHHAVFASMPAAFARLIARLIARLFARLSALPTPERSP